MSQPEIYDITRPLGPTTPVWPGDPAMQLEWMSRRAAGAIVNMASLRLGVHVGTHADAPYHVLDTGACIGAVPLETWIGPALVVDATDRDEIDVALVRSVLASHPSPERILFRTGAWADARVFPTSFPAIHPTAAKLLVEARVLLVGTDAPSVDPLESDSLETHHTFAAAGIVNLENLALDEVPAGEYELVALPLRLTEADGSPVRAVLRKP